MFSRFLSRFFSSPSTNIAMSSIKEIVDKSIAEHKVAIFSKSWCPYCKRVKELFSTNFPAIKAYVIELDQREDGDAIQEYLREKSGQRTVPNVYVHKQHIGGCDDTIKAFETGELTKLINEP